MESQKKLPLEKYDALSWENSRRGVFAYQPTLLARSGVFLIIAHLRPEAQKVRGLCHGRETRFKRYVLRRAGSNSTYIEHKCWRHFSRRELTPRSHSCAAQFNPEPVQNKPMLLSRDWLRLNMLCHWCLVLPSERHTMREREHGIDYSCSNLCNNFPYAAILVPFSI